MWTEKKNNFPLIIYNSEKLECSICAHVNNLEGSNIQGVSISKEWSSTLVSYYGKDRNAQLTSLGKNV